MCQCLSDLISNVFSGVILGFSISLMKIVSSVHYHYCRFLVSFLITISGLSESSLRLHICSLVRFGFLAYWILLLRRPNLNDIWKISRDWWTLLGFQVLYLQIFDVFLVRVGFLIQILCHEIN